MNSKAIPLASETEKQAARWVQGMFAEVAPKYDFLNHLLSLNIDRSWRKALLRRLKPALQRPNAQVLDLCCGTGDVLLELQGASRRAIFGADFCHPMLVAARHKVRQKGFRCPLIEADALNLPVRDDSIDAISIAFGFRNLANYETGLRELWRVLKPGGTLTILEFSHPRGILLPVAYGFYSRVVLPAVGSLISGSRDAYAYLPESIRKFPTAPELEKMMRQTGFANTRYELFTGGIAALHSGNKSAARGSGI